MSDGEVEEYAQLCEEARKKAVKQNNISKKIIDKNKRKKEFKDKMKTFKKK